MSIRKIHWINTPVIIEAMMRYEQKRLPPSLRLWVEGLLDLKDCEKI
tara:strand:- start:25 stop:165 length:141 start_codon:yes stop_codon:yes gene_type:complete